MNTTLCETKIAVTACLLAMAMFNVAAAHRGEGGACTDCHNKPGGSLTASPNPLDIQKGSNGLLTFLISSLGGSNQTAISVQGLENPALSASIAPGGNTWTYINGDSGMSYVSNTITATGPYTFNLAIGSLATLGTYPIVVMYAGNGERVTTTGFNLRVMMAALAGDYNKNGTVDAADYTLWRDNLGAATEASINNNGDGGGVTASDYTHWKTRFGNTPGSAAILSSAVPEPATLTSLVVGMLAMILWRARPRPGNCT
jgi:hypothetical protein